MEAETLLTIVISISEQEVSGRKMMLSLSCFQTLQVDFWKMG
jgi:hypothetical protein